MGAWIEIFYDVDQADVAKSVAPLVGAWIEIELLRAKSMIASSRSSRGSVD